MTTTTRRTLALAAALLMGAAGCTDITVPPKSTVTGANIFNDPASYRAFLAKLYAGLAVTGQQGGAGRGDISGIDEGFSQYVRLYWQMQELPTEEAMIAWNDAGVLELNTQIWSPSNQFLVSMYYRIFFQTGMVNEFLRETTDSKLSERNVGSALRTQIQGYRAEARFLRALSYWHGLDLFGSIPLVTEEDGLGSTPPSQATRTELFDYVVSELNAIRTELPAGAGVYGRASRAAADMLLAKLYLNSAVYTGTPRYAEARASAEAVINSGAFTLDNNYREMFLADNHTSPEIIFAVTQDGQNTRGYGGTTFLTHAGVGGNMNSQAYGLNGGWWGLRARPEFISLFPGGASTTDRRGSSVFFTNGQSLQINDMLNFQQGIGTPKYSNVTSTGAPGSDQEFSDVDYPMFRLADAYLIYAEAVLRGGGGTRAQALAYVNALRQRAYGDASGNIDDAALTLNFILDERGRELYWEGHRRQDLIRYDRFTDNGVWTFKGGVQAGRTTEAFRDLYPLPGSELLANPNLTQNAGYLP
jgi:starch-binding outer membrane protein, SusD/RagB family